MAAQLHIKNGLCYLKSRPPTSRELESDIPHIVLTSDADWDPTVLDHEVNVDEWAKEQPTDGPDESERPFDSLGILKANKTETNSTEDFFEAILDYFETFNQYLPTDGLYEASFDDNPEHLGPDIGVYEARRRPSALFVPESTVTFDLGPTSLAPSKPTKPPDTDTETPPRRSQRRCNSQGSSTGPKVVPPPRVDYEDPPNPLETTVYKNPSLAVKSHECDWE